MDSNSLNRIIQDAIEAIGTTRDDDYVIQPTRHAQEYEERASSLAKILKKSKIVVTAEQYESFDSNAQKAQSQFKGTAGWANLVVFITALCGTGILFVNALSPSQTSLFEMKYGLLFITFITLGLISIVTGGLGSRWLYMIRRGRLLDKWMKSRAEAETCRLKYFKLITQNHGGPDEQSTVPLPSFQLEYFRRYQLDVQLNYYRNRTKDHERAAERTLSLEGWAIFLSTIATGLAGFLWILSPRLTSVAALGVIGSSLALLASTKEQINQDQRNSERYRRTSQNLQNVAAKVDDVRRATAMGKQEPLEDFVAAVHEQLSLEHRQWIESAKDINVAFERLDKTLSEYRSSWEQHDEHPVNK
jgi:hypothetical protein